MLLTHVTIGDAKLLEIERKVIGFFSKFTSYISVSDGLKNQAQDSDSLASFDRRIMRAPSSRSSSVSTHSES